ncbi:Outer membrane porin F [Buchnera aphidicola (Periphyllus testudinaceus)]|uniref:porin n=1 Tax=Buchnera aphidicola TaxID=9 RepID=UPI003464ADDE
MMNRNSLAMLIPLFLASSSIDAKEIYNKNGQKINFYGEINPLYFYYYSYKPFSFHSLGNYTNLRIGFYNQTYINKYVSGYMHIEYHPKFSSEFNEGLANSFNKNNISLSYVGLDFGKWGSIDYGRNYGIIHYSKKFTNKFFDNTENIMFHRDDNFLLGRTDDVVTYTNKDVLGYLKGFNLILQHHNYCRNLESRITKKYNDSWGAALHYKNNCGFQIIGTTEINPYDENHNFNKKKYDWIKSYGVGCCYSFNRSIISGFYCHTRNIEHNFTRYHTQYKNLDGIEVAGRYDFNNGMHASVGYVKNFGKEIINGDYNKYSKNKILNHHFNFILTYNFGTNFIFNVHYKCSLLKNDNENSVPIKLENYFDNISNSIGTGMTYTF